MLAVCAIMSVPALRKGGANGRWSRRVLPISAIILSVPPLRRATST
jgi:hypothetical protein